MSDYPIRIKGDVVVTAPADLRRLSTAVLLEQEDWFEKEIDFLRRWLRPGMRAVDIGANIGVYTLTIAKRVGRDGAVWAFEPTPEPAASLRNGVARNGFEQVSVVERALSDQEGRATFHTSSQSELNSLVHSVDAAAALAVDVSTLDREQERLGWEAIDFVKIDAEGVCERILAGGKGFFARHSPLIMFEASDARSTTEPSTLPAAFRALGFEIYRLIGPDQMLVRRSPHEPVRAFQLNLFACKPDRAATLAAEGFLVSTPEAIQNFPDGEGAALYARQPYAPSFGALAPRSSLYARALDAFALWRDAAQPSPRRCGALGAAFVLAQHATRERPTAARIASLIRIAFDAGERQYAVDSLAHLVPLLANDPTPPDEPFFPPEPRYDGVDPRGATRVWLLAAAFEALEIAENFSGYFKPVADLKLDMLDWLQGTPFATAAMERRRQFQLWRAGKQPGLRAVPMLMRPAPDHLNADIWAALGN